VELDIDVILAFIPIVIAVNSRAVETTSVSSVCGLFLFCFVGVGCISV
jgi:hypothetical protein